MERSNHKGLLSHFSRKKTGQVYRITKKTMWDKFISLSNAVILHALLLSIVFISSQWVKEPPKILPIAPENIMQAVAIDESQWRAAAQSLKSPETDKSSVLRAQQREFEQKTRQIERNVLKETQRLDKLRQEKEKERQQLEEIKQRQLAEAEALFELKRKQAEQDRLKREAEEIRRIEEAYRQMLEAEEQARIASEVKRQAEQARLAEDAKRIQAERQARLEAENAEAARQAEDEKIRHLDNLIINKIRGLWKRPVGNYRGLSCMITLELTTTGEISSFKITRSSGNSIFDNSARKAAYSASPLPVPDDKELFEKAFKQITFTFKPDY